MNFRVCMCCGGPIRESGDVYSRNPNLCASCSSLTDGMPDPSLSTLPQSFGKTLVKVEFRSPRAEPAKSATRR